MRPAPGRGLGQQEAAVRPQPGPLLQGLLGHRHRSQGPAAHEGVGGQIIEVEVCYNIIFV